MWWRSPGVGMVVVITGYLCSWPGTAGGGGAIGSLAAPSSSGRCSCAPVSSLCPSLVTGVSTRVGRCSRARGGAATARAAGSAGTIGATDTPMAIRGRMIGHGSRPCCAGPMRAVGRSLALSAPGPVLLLGDAPPTGDLSFSMFVCIDGCISCMGCSCPFLFTALHVVAPLLGGQ